MLVKYLRLFKKWRERDKKMEGDCLYLDRWREKKKQKGKLTGTGSTPFEVLNGLEQKEIIFDPQGHRILHSSPEELGSFRTYNHDRIAIDGRCKRSIHTDKPWLCEA